MRTGQFREPYIALAGICTIPASVAAVAPTLTDGNEAALVLDTSGNLRTVIGNTTAAPVIVNNQNGIADTLTQAGSVVAPGIGVAIVTLAVVAGVYAVDILVGFAAGAPAAGDINNMVFKNNGAAVGNALFTGGTTGPGFLTRLARLTVAGAVNLTVNAIAVGTAGVNYVASISATRLA